MRKKDKSAGDVSNEDIARWTDYDFSLKPSEIAKSDMEAIAQKHVKDLTKAYCKSLDT